MSEKILKYFVSIGITVAVALLGLIFSTISGLNNKFFEFIDSNSKDHQEMKIEMKENYIWTHGVYENVIRPTLLRSIKNEEALNIHDRRLRNLEYGKK